MAAPDNDNTGSLLIEDPVLRLGFIQAPKQIVYARNLGHEAKSLYYILLDYAWQDGQCFPGYGRLNDDMCLSEKTTRQAMRQLEAVGLVRQKRRGLGKTNIYILCSLQSATLDLPERHRARLAQKIEPERDDTTEPEREKSRPGSSTVLDRDTPPVHIKEDRDSELHRTGCGADTAREDVRANAPTPKERKPRAVTPEAVTGAEHVAEQIATALGWASISPATRRKWADAIRPHLKDCTDAERERFPTWLVSNGYWCKERAHTIGGQLATEAESWVNGGKPITKVVTTTVAPTSHPRREQSDAMPAEWRRTEKPMTPGEQKHYDHILAGYRANPDWVAQQEMTQQLWEAQEAAKAAKRATAAGQVLQ